MSSPAARMDARIYRRFVTVGGRQVHYRTAGSGPPVLLLHQSPRSSAELVPLIRALAGGFTVLAPDTPGNGLSDPLDVNAPGIADYARATAEFIAALGAGALPVYGYHTGASIACALAAHYPDRVTVAVLNGLAAFDVEEQQELLARYLPPFEPQWDGSHLAWLWARLREQTIFFPWYTKAASTRMQFTVPAPEALTVSVLDFLRAGDAYRAPYGAAFAADATSLFASLRVPTFLMATDMDPLRPHLDRLRPYAPDVARVEPLGSDPALLPARLTEIFSAHAGDRVAPPEPPVFGALRRRLARGFLGLPAGDIHLIGNLDGRGRPVVLLHDFHEDAAVLRDIAAGLADARPVVALDLPGFGESDPLPAAEPRRVGAYADRVAAALTELQLESCDLLGVGLGSAVAADLCRRYAGVARRCVLVAPLPPGEVAAGEAPLLASDFEPDWAGGHLLRTWYMCRDRQLFHPWFDRRRERIIAGGHQLAPARVHRHAVAALKAGVELRLGHEAACAFDLDDTLAALGERAAIGRLHWERPGVGPADAWRSYPGFALPAHEQSWGSVLLPFFGQA